ncbi:hypothetical protein CW732_05975 [Olleya sp. Bg11-27]|nr:hypothetical protein CW732_05975 [Olleya sp. Bg11-27]
MCSIDSYAQVFTTNQTPIGMEHNVLFHANRSESSLTVTQTGAAQLDVDALFDGRLSPSYTVMPPTLADPIVVLIEGLPNVHSQAGAWIGWSTRYWEARRFKIEGYNSYSSANTWNVIADHSSQDYAERKFIKKVPAGSYTKLRFTFYDGAGTNGRLGVSELFYIHPEAVTPYQGLIAGASSSLWESNSSGINNISGNIGIGTTTPTQKLEVANGSLLVKSGNIYITGVANDAGDLIFQKGTSDQLGRIWTQTSGDSGLYLSSGDNAPDLTIDDTGNVGVGTTNTQGFKLGVNGKIVATEVKVAGYPNWPDFVFYNDYKLPTLEEVENHINEKGRLKDIPSAKEVEENGVFLGEINSKLLQKIEELTLYVIQQEKELKQAKKKAKLANEALNQLGKRFSKLEAQVEKLNKNQ